MIVIELPSFDSAVAEDQFERWTVRIFLSSLLPYSITKKKKKKKKNLGQCNFIIKSSYLAGHLIRYATLREASRFSRFLEGERSHETTGG